MDTFVNSVDPDETARENVKHRLIMILIFIDFWLKPYLQQ